jgi:hypothetical protein
MFDPSSIHVRTKNFRRATWACQNPKSKAMQFDDRSEAEAQAFGASTYA